MRTTDFIIKPLVGLLVGVLAPAASLASGEMCASVFRTEVSQETRAETANSHLLAIESVKGVTKLEKQLRLLEWLSGKYERSTVVAEMRRRTLLGMQIELNEVRAAIDSYRMTFRDVEFSYHVLKQAENLDGRLSATDQVKLKKEVSSAYKNFGRAYGEYKAVREYLETLSLENSQRGKNAATILRALGIHNLKNLFPGLALPAERASINDISTFFRTHPEALIAKLKEDRRDQFYAALKSFAGPAISITRVALRRIPQKYRKVGYDLYLRDRYFDQIERIIRMDNVEKQFQTLRELNSLSEKKDELLVTFARLANATDVWAKIRTHANTRSPESEIYASFAQRLEAAEKQAIQDGELSLYYQASGSQKVVLATYFVGAIYGESQTGVLQNTAGWMGSKSNAIIDSAGTIIQSIF